MTGGETLEKIREIMKGWHHDEVPTLIVLERIDDILADTDAQQQRLERIPDTGMSRYSVELEVLLDHVDDISEACAQLDEDARRQQASGL